MTLISEHYLYNVIFILQAHMVAAFEQSLSNMTSRLQHLTASAEQKVIMMIFYVKYKLVH